jgi:hypothetical protein
MHDSSEEVRYLREKAKQFRELAATFKTEMSKKLVQIAADFEARAAELEKQR